jgi:hypothetical protein
VDPKLFFLIGSTFRRVLDPDPTFFRVIDPDPTLNWNFSSMQIIFKMFYCFFNHTVSKKICFSYHKCNFFDDFC